VRFKFANIPAFASLLLLLLLATAYVDTRQVAAIWRMDNSAQATSRKGLVIYQIEMGRGRVAIRREDVTTDADTLFEFTEMKAHEVHYIFEREPALGRVLDEANFVGFGCSSSSAGFFKDAIGQAWTAIIPLWLPILLLAILPARAIWRAAVRIDRSARYLCPECGYDTRECGMVCSECGASRTAPRGGPRRRYLRIALAVLFWLALLSTLILAVHEPLRLKNRNGPLTPDEALALAEARADPLEVGDALARDPSQWLKDSTLFRAVLDNDDQLIDVLLHGGANPNAVLDRYRYNGLYSHPGAGQRNAFPYPVDPLPASIDSISVLDLAIMFSDRSVVEWIVAAGGKVDLSTFHCSLLFVSETIDADRAEEFDLLRAAGARLDGIDDRGNTPLHSAVLHHDLALTQRLLAAGANPHIRQKQGITPFQMLKNPSWPEGNALLRKHDTAK
jgi:hypothetical protein